MLRNRGRVCPLLTAPWVKTKIFRFDWLHVADLGVAPDFIGNFLEELMAVVPGNGKKEKCRALTADLLGWYDDEQVQDRFDCILPTMFEPKNGAYKMRGSAAKLRSLVPWIYKISVEMLDTSIPKYAAMAQAAYHLDQCYSAPSADHTDPQACMKERSVKFALQYVARHDFWNHVDDKAWRLKPKLHLFLHICGDDPSLGHIGLTEMKTLVDQLQRWREGGDTCSSAPVPPALHCQSLISKTNVSG